MRRRRSRVTIEDLRAALDAYEAAVEAGIRDPLTATAAAIHSSRATAGRRVKRARQLLTEDEEG